MIRVPRSFIIFGKLYYKHKYCSGIFLVAVMFPAAIVTAPVITAYMAFSMMMVMMIAPHIGVIVQLAFNVSRNCRIRIAGNSAVQLNSGCRQCHLRTAANAAADQHICVQCRKNTGQCTVPAAVGVNNLRSNNRAVFNIIDLKLFGMTEVLVNFFIRISNCNFSFCVSSLYHARISFARISAFLSSRSFVDRSASSFSVPRRSMAAPRRSLA